MSQAVSPTISLMRRFHVPLKYLFPIFLLSQRVCCQELLPEELYERVLPSVMTLRVETRDGENFVGTAFLALDEGIAVTAWHVVSDATRVTAKFSDNKNFEVEGVVDKNEHKDLALLKVKET